MGEEREREREKKRQSVEEWERRERDHLFSLINFSLKNHFSMI